MLQAFLASCGLWFNELLSTPTSADFQSSPKAPLLSLSSFDNSESVPHVLAQVRYCLQLYNI